MDGLYLDGIAYDRTTMKRCRKVMDAAKDKQPGSEGALIDIHSGNNFSPQYGMVSPALQYMMLLPYMDSTMFGEGYQPGYDRPAGTGAPIDGGGPDWWLIEVSAIPFGLMNDMLANGQRWRGWLFGSVTRLPYQGGKTNKADWEIWDRYELTKATMIGWWSKQTTPPVQVVAPAGTTDAATIAACSSSSERTGHVLATAYILKGQHTLVSIASWSNLTASCDLKVDWAALGLPVPKSGSAIKTQTIAGFQNESSFTVEAGRVKAVATAPAKGWLLVLGTDIPAPVPPPPPPPFAPPQGHFVWQNISMGGPGSGSSCSGALASSCIFDAQRCVKLAGQCAILETEAEEKCGSWAECDGVVCRAGYKGYCLARFKMSSDANSDMWGYRKQPKVQ